jgi:hypothetical protein
MFHLPIGKSRAVDFPFQDGERMFARLPISIKTSVSTLGPNHKIAPHTLLFVSATWWLWNSDINADLP